MLGKTFSKTNFVMTAPTLPNNQRQKRALGPVSAALAAQAGLVYMALATNLNFRGRNCTEGGIPNNQSVETLNESLALVPNDAGPALAVFPPFCE